MTDFKITVPHNEAEDWHEWYFPGQYREHRDDSIESRDKAGRAQGNREGYFSAWFVLACSNVKCPGRAVVPVSLLTEHADSRDEQVTQ